MAKNPRRVREYIYIPTITLMKKKIISSLIALIVLIPSILWYQSKVQSALNQEVIIYIDKEDSFDSINTKLNPFLKHKRLFKTIADLKKYPLLIKTGKYTLSEELSIIDLINKLRIGDQDAVAIKFNNQENLESLAARLADQIATDSTSIIQAMQDEVFLQKNGFNKETALAMYIPNTYEVYWNISAKDLIGRFLKEYKRFWNDKRLSLAKKQNLTAIEVSTLASIVQKESSFNPERPIIAGLYLNRINRGIPLQSDPTVIYVLHQKYGENFEVRRVLTKDTYIQSPYNTYQNKGLPPGPISMPDINAIEAVLNPQKHNYIYMCASVEQPGQHEFARTLKAHNANARKYQNWINTQGIKR